MYYVVIEVLHTHTVQKMTMYAVLHISKWKSRNCKEIDAGIGSRMGLGHLFSAIMKQI